MLESLFHLRAAMEQMARANHAQTTGELASRLANDVKLQNDDLMADLEKLYLITAAMWSMLKETHGFTDEMLAARMDVMDRLDGKKDGRMSPGQRAACPACKRKLTKRQPLCLYCGATVSRGAFER